MGRGSESLSRGSIKLTQRNDLSRVLLATWKAEIRRILVQGQPWPKKKKKSKTLSQKVLNTKKGLVEWYKW
jgi:hypothetical protein